MACSLKLPAPSESIKKIEVASIVHAKIRAKQKNNIACVVDRNLKKSVLFLERKYTLRSGKKRSQKVSNFSDSRTFNDLFPDTSHWISLDKIANNH